MTETNEENTIQYWKNKSSEYKHIADELEELYNELAESSQQLEDHLESQLEKNLIIITQKNNDIKDLKEDFLYDKSKLQNQIKENNLLIEQLENQNGILKKRCEKVKVNVTKLEVENERYEMKMREMEGEVMFLKDKVDALNEEMVLNRMESDEIIERKNEKEFALMTELREIKEKYGEI